MNTAFTLFAGFGLGIAVGLAYFAGLWLTVRRVVACANPRRRMLGLSRTVRLLPTLVVMAMVIRFDPALFLAMMPGFLLGRFLVNRWIVRPQEEGLHVSHS